MIRNYKDYKSSYSRSSKHPASKTISSALFYIYQFLIYRTASRQIQWILYPILNSVRTYELPYLLPTAKGLSLLVNKNSSHLPCLRNQIESFLSRNFLHYFMSVLVQELDCHTMCLIVETKYRFGIAQCLVNLRNRFL